MADLVTVPSYDPVYQLESADDVQGGAGGISNWQAQALGNRDDFLQQFINDTILFSKVNIYHVPIGGIGWSGILSASDSGSIWIMEPGGIDGFFHLPLFSSVPDNYVIGFWQPNGSRAGNYTTVSCTTGDTIIDRSANSTPNTLINIFEGGAIIKKNPGSTSWEVIIRFDRDAGAGTICLRPSASAINDVGWFPCAGYTIACVDYPELFDKVGYSFGGSGAFFMLPTITVGIAGTYWAIHV